MKRLLVILFVLLLSQGASAQEFSGFGVGLSPIKQTTTTTFNYNFFIKGYSFEFGSDYGREETLTSINVGYAYKLPEVNAYLIPNVGVVFSGSTFKYNSGFNLLVMVDNSWFVVTGISVQQPAKVAVGYKF